MGSGKNTVEMIAMVVIVILVVLVLVKVVAILLSSLFVIAAFGLGYLVGRYRRHEAGHGNGSGQASDE